MTEDWFQNLENALLRLSVLLIRPSCQETEIVALAVWASGLPRVRWLLTVYEFAISEVEKFEKVVNVAVRKWLGLQRC